MRLSRFFYRMLIASMLVLLPMELSAHRQWMLPSSTVVSGTSGWVTIDAAVSNELFYFDHVPMRLASLLITAPDGTVAEPQNTSTGKYRSTFDVHLEKQGTYKIASISSMVMASWQENGETKRWRGLAVDLEKHVPADGKSRQVTKSNNRVEVFVTAGKPSLTALKSTGVGLELVPVTHPNDLVAGETAEFQFLNNGKPASGLTVTVIPGGNRYRDELHEQKFTTNAEGKVSIPFSDAGMYWMNASTAPPRSANTPSGSMAAPSEVSNYVATLEVLPQ